MPCQRDANVHRVNPLLKVPSLKTSINYVTSNINLSLLRLGLHLIFCGMLASFFSFTSHFVASFFSTHAIEHTLVDLHVGTWDALAFEVAMHVD
jgi:hypothetical protein